MTAAQSPNPNAAATAPKRGASLLRKIWRVVYWAMIVAGAWGIVQMLRVAPAPQAAMSPAGAESTREKLMGLVALAERAPSASETQRITLTEGELNSFLAERLQAANSGPMPGQWFESVRDLKVTFSGDEARIYALFNVLGKDLSFEMEGRLQIVDGYLRFEPTGGSLGKLELSQSALGLVISQLMNNPQTREAFRMPPAIREIHVENGELVVEYQ